MTDFLTFIYPFKSFIYMGCILIKIELDHTTFKSRFKSHDLHLHYTPKRLVPIVFTDYFDLHLYARQMKRMRRKIKKTTSTPRRYLFSGALRSIILSQYHI